LKKKNKKIFLKDHYNKLFLTYKNSHLTAQQSTRKTQEIRMEMLLSRVKLKKSDKILDFGCGTAHLYKFLLKKKINVNYTGIDIADQIINYNKKKYDKNKKVRFINLDILNSKKNIGDYDYTFISGTFNNKISNNWIWMQKSLIYLFKKTKKILVFNNLSFYVDYYDDNLFYVKPEKVFSFCKKKLSPYVSIFNDYQIKKGVIPYEFTTFVYKKNDK
jgi:SAM-dependent methyltransferase